MAKAKGNTTTKKKEKKIISSGKVYVQASFNNTIITVTDKKGNVLSWSSSGSIQGFRGAKKSTPFAAQIVAESAAKKAIEGYGLKDVDVFVKGPGVGRESAIRALDGCGLRVNLIRDITPVPHNGCRPKKRRRV
ncbi:MAG: 30S ribosomal protein S11 [Spirochaetes bacterium GWF1_31_7]|nr:MAG: 30S ribosomal protein S11 [Spirochaetes bacterium GWE1_32_154]OHD47300.1 MAG: 30S ribosomal protein S11 [Spirochaetes bacterium GWE2_31_10]OHD47359.1 MAG: 30S ribosomal protein S11 [Spirochaetes bacterium GWF1_31_7]OHD74816.1 MAG: 30S ribosomal protein S11 [Spirochaetes bacterium RIFOXYB1_FULL_32_8]HBD92811.1 30S ribosomal protein S11 [Spirochaetia bacterium]